MHNLNLSTSVIAVPFEINGLEEVEYKEYCKQQTRFIFAFAMSKAMFEINFNVKFKVDGVYKSYIKSDHEGSEEITNVYLVVGHSQMSNNYIIYIISIFIEK